VLGSMPIEVLSTLSIDDMDIDWIMEISQEPESWMTPIREYLLSGTLPENPRTRQKLLRKVPRYIIPDGQLYRPGFSTPLLRCVTKEE